MKHALLGIALLLAATAAAQTKTGNRPVMSMSNPSQYLELKFGTAPPASPAPAEQPPRKFDPDKPSADEKGLQAGDYAKSAEYYDRAIALGMESSKQKAEKAKAAMGQKGN